MKRKREREREREREQRKKNKEGREAEIEKVRQGKGILLYSFLAICKPLQL